MRIIAGAHRGRRLVAPKGSTTRPTTDRVREAVFSALSSIVGPDLGGGAVLDAFAGSGALGLEAASRGAGPVIFVEQDRSALAALRANVATLALDSARIVTGDVFVQAGLRLPGAPFALILLDPPYKLDTARVGALLAQLAGEGALRAGALVYWEHATDVEPVWPEGFAVVRSKRYGTIGADIAVWGRVA